MEEYLGGNTYRRAVNGSYVAFNLADSLSRPLLFLSIAPQEIGADSHKTKLDRIQTKVHTTFLDKLTNLTARRLPDSDLFPVMREAHWQLTTGGDAEYLDIVNFVRINKNGLTPRITASVVSTNGYIGETPYILVFINGKPYAAFGDTPVQTVAKASGKTKSTIFGLELDELTTRLHKEIHPIIGGFDVPYLVYDASMDAFVSNGLLPSQGLGLDLMVGKASNDTT